MSFRILPIGTDALPAINGWPTKATSEPPAVWLDGPIAIETTGLIVVDLDVNHENAFDGFASWEAVGIRDSAHTVETARGGRHMFWRLPDDADPAEYRSSTSQIAPGVDIKSWHSYVRVHGDLPTFADDLQVAPGALLSLVHKVARASTNEGRSTAPHAASVHPWVASAVEGITADLRTTSTHNDAQTRAALRLTELSNNPRSGLTTEAAYAAYSGACALWDEKSEYRWTYAQERLRDVMAYVPDAVEDPIDETLEQETARAYVAIKARQNAERQLAAESYTGTRDLDWDNLFEFADDDWLIEDFIGRGSTNLLVARPNLGKTFTYLDAILRGSTGGGSWLGLDVAAFTTLVYVSEGANAFGHRVQAWARLNGEQDPIETVRNVHVRAGANIASDAFLAKFREDVEALRPDLVVFDTFNGTAGVADENAAAQIAVMNTRARSVAPDAALLFTHHPTKETENTSAPRGRGSGSLVGLMDTVMTMFVDKTFDGAHDEYLAISTEHAHAAKSRDAAGRTIQGLYVEPVVVGFKPNGTAVESCALLWDSGATYTKADRAVREHLTEPMTVQEFADLVGVSKATAGRHLEASPFAKILEPASGRNPAKWALVD